MIEIPIGQRAARCMKHGPDVVPLVQHAPGPWEVRVCKDDGYIQPSQFIRVYGQRGKSDWIADCGLSEEQSANARLIAAAPNLLEALKALAGAVEGFDFVNDPGIRGAYDLANDAIQKAEDVSQIEMI